MRKSGQHISTQEVSALWKRAAPIPPATGATASDAIAAVVEVAPQAAEVSEEERADEQMEEEETEAQEESPAAGGAVAVIGVHQVLQEEELMLTLADLEQGHFLPMGPDESFAEFEVRMAHVLSSVLPSERPQAEERMMDLILQGHFQTEAQRKGLTVVQVRALLRGLGPLLNEVPIAFANRFAACVQVYSRMALSRSW